jgi:hypothetical protein
MPELADNQDLRRTFVPSQEEQSRGYAGKKSTKQTRGVQALTSIPIGTNARLMSRRRDGGA